MRKKSTIYAKIKKKTKSKMTSMVPFFISFYFTSNATHMVLTSEFERMEGIRYYSEQDTLLIEREPFRFRKSKEI